MSIIDYIGIAIAILIIVYSIWKRGFINTIKLIIIEVEDEYFSEHGIIKLTNAVSRLNSKSIIIRYLISNKYLEKLIKELIAWAKQVQPVKDK
jgi:hypothetical protein